MTARKPLDTWAKLLADIAGGLTGRPVIDRAARLRGVPTRGEATRTLLRIWAEYSGPVSGGTLKLANAGFGINGNRHEPFLSHVCGAKPKRQCAILEDLEHDPAAAALVHCRIHELGDRAATDLPRIGGMAIGGGLGRAMFQAMCNYLVNLSEVAKAVRPAETTEK